MYDSVNVDAIPADAQVVAGYVNGQWPTFFGLAAKFPSASLVSIDVNGQRPGADVLDIEPGNVGPEAAPAWVAKHVGPKLPVLYCSVSAAHAVMVAMTSSSLLYKLWTAHYTGVAHLCSAACGYGTFPEGLVVATQWADPKAGSGGDYDVSLCIEGWPA